IGPDASVSDERTAAFPRSVWYNSVIPSPREVEAPPGAFTAWGLLCSGEPRLRPRCRRPDRFPRVGRFVRWWKDRHGWIWFYTYDGGEWRFSAERQPRDKRSSSGSHRGHRRTKAMTRGQ